MNPLLQSREWLIQPEALRSMALAVRAFNERGSPLPQSRPQSPLLTVQDGIGSVSIEGPILRKPNLFARVLMGTTGSNCQQTHRLAWIQTCPVAPSNVMTWPLKKSMPSRLSLPSRRTKFCLVRLPALDSASSTRATWFVV